MRASAGCFISRRVVRMASAATWRSSSVDEIIRRDRRRLVGLAERMRTVPREVGCRLQALTVMAGKRCRGSPNLSSDSGCTWNWMLARSRRGSERVKMPSCDGAMVSGPRRRNA